MERRTYLKVGGATLVGLAGGAIIFDDETEGVESTPTQEPSRDTQTTPEPTETSSQTIQNPSTPRETSTAQPAQVVKELSQSFYTDGGTFGVEGKIKNITDRKIWLLEITVKFFSEKGVRVASAKDEVQYILPGQTVMYHAEGQSTSEISSKRVGDWSVSFDASFTHGKASIPNVDVLSKERYTTNTGNAGLRGRIKNISDETIDISLEVTFFTDHGETLGKGYGEITGLTPGKVARYDLQTTFSFEKKNVQNYKLRIIVSRQ